MLASLYYSVIITYNLIGALFFFDLSDHLENPRASSACNEMQYYNAGRYYVK